jgi:aldehyde dehydrogenase (NAD+)
MVTGLDRDGLYIGGKWVDAASDEQLAVVNPATEEVIGHVPQASVGDVDRAVEAARRAHDEGPWRRMAPRARSDALLRFLQVVADRRNDLVDLIIAEAGAARPIAQALQFDTPLRYANWFAERAATFPFQDPLPPQVSPRGLGQGVILKEPIGVIAAITPFNFPLYLNLVKIVRSCPRSQWATRSYCGRHRSRRSRRSCWARSRARPISRRACSTSSPATSPRASTSPPTPASTW